MKKIAFGLSTVAYLKLIEKGVPKEKLGLLALPLTPFEVVLPLLISRYTNGPNPLSIFTKAYPFRFEKKILLKIKIVGFYFHFFKKKDPSWFHNCIMGVYNTLV